MTESNVVEGPSTDELTWIGYEEFGKRFIAEAVTIERITEAVADMSGAGVKIGPATLGPGGMAGFFAEGAVGKPRIVSHDGDDVRFDVLVPASLVLSLRLGGQVRFEAGVEIRLRLTARPADPLLIVIDIPKVTPDDVTVIVRAEALGSAGEWLLDPITRLTRGEVAARINTMLFHPKALRRRVFDVTAMIEHDYPHRSEQTTFEWLTYREFGGRFFENALTPERVTSEVGARDIEIGPLRTGPGDKVTVTATGDVHEPRMQPRAGELVSFDLIVPVTLDLVISITKDNHYRADIEVPLVITARAADPLLLVVQQDPVNSDDVDVVLTSKGLSASVIRVLGGVKKQIRGQVTKQINREIAKSSGRTVDIARQIGSRV